MILERFFVILAVQEDFHDFVDYLECFERRTLKLYTWKLIFQFSFLLRRVRTDALCIGFRLLLPRI